LSLVFKYAVHAPHAQSCCMHMFCGLLARAVPTRGFTAHMAGRLPLAAPAPWQQSTPHTHPPTQPIHVDDERRLLHLMGRAWAVSARRSRCCGASAAHLRATRRPSSPRPISPHTLYPLSTCTRRGSTGCSGTKNKEHAGGYDQSATMRGGRGRGGGDGAPSVSLGMCCGGLARVRC
jgi:hypothetical protein